MLRKLVIGLVVVFAVALATNMLAKEPDKEEPLRKRVFIRNSVEITLMLLHTELVQEEIGLTDAQKAKVKPLVNEMRDAYDKIYGDKREAPESEEEEIRIAQATEEVDKRVQEKLDEILQPRQLDRVWEIILQLDCLGSQIIFRLPKLGEELYKILAISENQADIFRDIHSDTEIAVGDVRPYIPVKKEEMSIGQCREIVHEHCEKMWPIIDRANKKVQAVLTRKQRDTIAKMQGKEIDHIKLIEQIYALDFEFEQSQETAGGEEKKDN